MLVTLSNGALDGVYTSARLYVILETLAAIYILCVRCTVRLSNGEEVIITCAMFDNLFFNIENQFVQNFFKDLHYLFFFSF